MSTELNQFVDRILNGTGLELSANDREKLAKEAVGIIVDRSLNALGQTFASEEDMQKIDAYAKTHTPEETWNYLVAEIPKFQQLFRRQLELYVEEFQALAKASPDNQ